MKRVAFLTIGCKLNQFETEQMREAVGARGYHTSPAFEEADVYVVNTCTVTSKSDRRSRQAVRRAIRSNPGALVVVTGCYAQRKPHELAGIKGVDVVIGNAEKEGIEEYLNLGKQQETVVKTTPTDDMADLASRRHLHGFGSYTRAFAKIQDGCDNHCTYCVVPLARGRSRSKSLDVVRREIETTVAEGYGEIVLTGVHLGSYGRDLAPQTSLAALLRVLAPTKGLTRMRLSSIEPTDFGDDLIDMLADPASKLCPHVHVPLQSGDDRILRLMGRPYGRSYYRSLIERIAVAVPRCGIGADVMVAFPAEDRAAFMNTFDLVSDLPITYLHTFAFSPRDGTAAQGFAGQVRPEEKKERSRVMRDLGSEKSMAFRHRLVGEMLETLVLRATVCGRATGLSGNYVRVFFDKGMTPNTVVSGRVSAISGAGVAASACGGQQ